jgi:hypothetical protein
MKLEINHESLICKDFEDDGRGILEVIIQEIS